MRRKFKTRRRSKITIPRTEHYRRAKHPTHRELKFMHAWLTTEIKPFNNFCALKKKNDTMKTKTAVIVISVNLLFSLSAFGSWQGAIYFSGVANQNLGLAHYFTDTAQIQARFQGTTNYTALYRAYQWVVTARNRAWSAFLQTPVGSSAETYAYRSYAQLNWLQSYLWTIYQNGGRYYSQNISARTLAFNANSNLSLTINAANAGQ